MRYRTLGALVVAVALGGTACGDSAFGDLLVHYRLGSGGAAETCASFGVAVIRVTVYNSDREPLVEDSVCSDTRQEALLRHVPADVYTVTVEGLNADGQPAYRGEQQNVSVAADTVTETRPIAIAVLPPGVRLVWGFADGLMCAPHDVSEIQVVAWLNGNARVYDEVLACNTGLTEIELMPGTYDLRVRAIDDNSGDYSFGWDREDVALEAGGGMIQVVASLTACPEGGCTAP